MKSNKELRDIFFSLIEEFNVSDIAELAAEYPKQIPYIEMQVLEKACRDFTCHEDNRSIKALIESGFQIFACPEFMGVKDDKFETPIDILHIHWTVQKIPSMETAELMNFIYETCYEAASKMFLGSEKQHSSTFKTHEVGLTELKAYFDSKATYEKVVDEISVNHDAQKLRLKSSRPLVKYAL